MSERPFPTAYANALDDTEIALAAFLHLDWPGGASRWWSGVGPFSWDGHTWTGAGELGDFDKIADGLSKADRGVWLTLNYLDDDVRNEVNTNDPVGSEATFYLNLVNPATLAVTEMKALFAGFIDEVDIEDAGSEGAIRVRLASELARMKRSTYYCLSDAHQQRLFPGDRGMEFAPHMDQPVLWGRRAAPVFPARPTYPGDPGVDPNVFPHGFPIPGGP